MEYPDDCKPCCEWNGIIVVEVNVMTTDINYYINIFLILQILLFSFVLIIKDN